MFTKKIIESFLILSMSPCILGALQDFDKVKINTNYMQHSSINSENATKSTITETSKRMANDLSEQSKLTKTTVKETDGFFM